MLSTSYFLITAMNISRMDWRNHRLTSMLHQRRTFRGYPVRLWSAVHSNQSSLGWPQLISRCPAPTLPVHHTVQILRNQYFHGIIHQTQQPEWRRYLFKSHGSGIIDLDHCFGFQVLRIDGLHRSKRMTGGYYYIDRALRQNDYIHFMPHEMIGRCLAYHRWVSALSQWWSNSRGYIPTLTQPQGKLL